MPKRKFYAEKVLGTMDIIFLNGMAVETLVGVYEWERQHSQTLYLDLQVGIVENSQRNDDLNLTLSYADIAACVRSELAVQSFQLLESVGEHIAVVLLQQTGVVEVTVKVVKPETAMNKEASIKLTVPNSEDLFASKVADSFEEAVDLAIDALDRQLVKLKEKK